jgi:hypothetical protein
VARRDFLKQSALCGLAAGAAGAMSWTDVIAANADQLRSRGMACILLWMQGGPSQFETFSPLARHANGGETKAIATSVSGIQVAEHLPHVAKEMGDIAIIRSMTSKEGNHQRATYFLHHGYLPIASVKHPTLGANIAREIGDATSQLPNFVQIGGRLPNSGGGGLLGIDFDPFVLQSATRPPQDTTPSTEPDRYARRLRLLQTVDRGFVSTGGAQVVADQEKLVRRASDMIHSPKMEAFELEREPRKLRDAYGKGEFAAGCMMARRLVERGVTFVEVWSKGWDTHQDNFERTKQLAGQIDQPYAQLLIDLRQRGMLDKTLVIWMGEFGRTPRINPRAGRDPYPKAFNVALAGSGVRGGQVIGRVNESGTDVADRPVTVQDLFRTVFHGLSIDADKENMSSIGRPIALADGGEVINEVFG